MTRSIVSAFLLLVPSGLHHNHNILLVVFRITLVYHDDVPNQEFNPWMEMHEILPYHFMLSKGYYLLFPAEKVQHLLKGNTKINPCFVGYRITSIMTPTSTVFVTLIRKAITCTQPSICWVGFEDIS